MSDFLKKEGGEGHGPQGIKYVYAFLVYCYKDPDSGEFKFDLQSEIYDDLFKNYPGQQAADLKLTYNILGAYLHGAIKAVREWYTRPFDAEKAKMVSQFGEKLPADDKE